MNRILLLGGTGDALQVAKTLSADDVYSLAGLGGRPSSLPCAVRIGGFGGVTGLEAYLRTEGITRIVDATHPYAINISSNARQAAQFTGIEYWQLERQQWVCQPGDDWRVHDDWKGIVAALKGFRRVLITLGRAPLTHLAEIPLEQHWFIRCLGEASQAGALTERSTFIPARGPFTLEGEREVFDRLFIDVVVSKNSGGSATQAKLEVARERGVPVVMLGRSDAGTGQTDSTNSADSSNRSFTTIAALLQAMNLQSKIIP